MESEKSGGDFSREIFERRSRISQSIQNSWNR